jgi:hypothetical protein
MTERHTKTNEQSAVENPPALKKRYQDPAFRHERIFETMALSCGKVQVTNPVCFHSRKNS